jgi:transcriptional regulator with XRE-family HTH domain
MDNLARLREAQGLTQTELADAIGANQATISKIERGIGNPSLATIIKIASALGVHPTDLFSRDMLEQRAISALNSIKDGPTREAAVTVLEAMSQKPPND